MELTLTPQVETLLHEEMARGKFHDESELIETALLSLRDVTPLNLEELNAAIQEGLDSADRGELYTEEEVRAYLKAERAKW